MFDNYPQYEYLFAQIQLVLFMLGTGATLSAADFGRIVQQPKYFLVGGACQFLVTPLLAVLIIGWFDLAPGLAVGLILVAVMPGGTMSKVFAYIGKGNLALSVTLTACGTLGAIVTVPLMLRLLAYEYVPEDFDMPVGWIVRDVGLYLLLPLWVGMAVAEYAPERRLRFSKWCIRLGFVFVVLMVLGALGSGRIQPREHGWKVPLAIIAFCLASMQMCMLPFRLFGWPRSDCLSVGMEVTMRNLNLALLLKALLFPANERGSDPIADGVLFVILYYGGVAGVAGVPLALNFRRMAKRDAAREAIQKPQ